MNGLEIKDSEMKPTQEQVIAWAREAGIPINWPGVMPYFEHFAALAYEAGQESMKWDGIHSCHPDCQRPACVHTRKTYQEGYEAGRKDENEAAIEDARTVGGEAGAEMEKLIRARIEQ
jgi:hypothetical protein